MKESAPVGFVTFRTDHLLLERVITISQTDKLIWQSPCKQGQCVHEGGMREEKEEEPSKVSEKEEPEVSEKPVSEVEPVFLRAVEHARFSSWVVALNSVGIGIDGFSSRCSVAMEEIDAEPMPPCQSFSATTEVLTEALEQLVEVASPRDMAPLYEEFLNNGGAVQLAKSKETSDDNEKSDKDKKEQTDSKADEPKVFIGTFDEVDRTASAIFQDKEQAEAEARKISEDLKRAAAREEGSNGSSTGDTAALSDNGDEWPGDLDESHRRGSSKDSGTSTDFERQGDSPYKSQFDLSGLKRPGSDSDSGASLDKSQMFGKGKSIFATLVKVVVVTVVFVVIGAVGLLFLGGGSQTAVADGGTVTKNELGLPVLTGTWQLKLWVETESGNISYGETTANVVQKGQTIQATGKDGNGRFTITGNIGQDGQVVVAFVKQYDVTDGRQHPYPTRFSGVVGPEPGSNVIAQGSFANRLMQDMPELGKHKFEKITGYWSLSLLEETMIGKVRKMIGI